MKKLSMVVVAMVILAGVAYASSVSVPWFVDMNIIAPGLPPGGSVVITQVFLKNNTAETLTCEIEYFSATGVALGPGIPGTASENVPNTFQIAPMAALAFRPSVHDPDPGAGTGIAVYDAFGNPTTVDGTGGGLESLPAVLVPIRPRGEVGGFNGSITISWVGEPTDVQGMVWFQGGQALDAISFSYLMPPGA